jgi:TRAP-type C4-dicarboxylate transport system permease small subunit
MSGSMSDLVKHYAGLAERMLPWVVVLFVAALLLIMRFFWYRSRVKARIAEGTLAAGSGWMRVAAPVVMAFAIVASLGNVYTTYEVGHGGAKATWDDAPAGEREGGSSEGSELTSPV